MQGLTAYTVASLPSATLESCRSHDRHDNVMYLVGILTLGDTKLALSSLGSSGGTREGLLATIRLRSGEEGTSLWQMRCLDATLTATLRSIFDDC